MAKDQSYVPTSGELNGAIANFLREHKNPDDKEVRAFIMKEHRTWRVPERRVRKFVKRQTHASNTPVTSRGSTGGGDEDSVVSSSSVSRRVKGIVKGAGRLFGRKKAQGELDNIPIMEIQTTMPKLLSPITHEESTEEELLLPPTPVSKTQNPESGKDDLTETEATDAEATVAEVMDAKVTNAEATEEYEVTDQMFNTRAVEESLINKDEATEKHEVTDREVNLSAVDESLIYKDDNDGKKDRPCAPCEGCIIM